MNVVSTMVGLSIMGAAAPSMMTMSLAPFEAQKRATNFGIAESSAVSYSAQNEGKPQLVGDVPDGCEITELADRAYEIECTEGQGQFIKTAKRSFRLYVPPSSSQCDNDGNNGNGNSGGNDCSNPGNGNGNGNGNNVTSRYEFETPERWSGTQCPNTDRWGVYGYNEDNYDREGGACIPQDMWASVWYFASDPEDWLYDVNNFQSWGQHPLYDDA